MFPEKVKPGMIGSLANIGGNIDIIDKVFQMSAKLDGKMVHDIYYQGRTGTLSTIDNVDFMEKSNVLK